MHAGPGRAVRSHGTLITALAGAALCLGPIGAALGQSFLDRRPAAMRVGPRIPQRETAVLLMRPITIQFDNQRLEAVINFIRDTTNADIDAKYIDDKHTDGLDPEEPISLRAENVTALQLIEMVLERAESEFAAPGSNTWQFTDTGTLEIGPKERLNQRRRVEIYNIADMLTEVPEYTEAPTFDLNSILQSGGGGGGGGGGQSPFQGQGQDDNWNLLPAEEKAEEIQLIITELVEPEQWLDGGGESTIRYWNGNFIVNAPDFVHRGLNGYPWWPAASTQVSSIGGRRYVTLNQDVAFAELDDLISQPVSAVVGGRIVRSDDPGG